MFFRKKIDYRYSRQDTALVGQGDVDKSGRIISRAVHTDGFSLMRSLRLPTIDIYILKEQIPAFIVAEMFFTFVYLIKGIQEAVEQIVNKGLPASEVLSVIGYMIGKALPLTTPMALLMSGIVVAGRFSMESEFTAMRAAGISYWKIFRPFFAFAVFIAILTFFNSNYLSPYSFQKFDQFQHFVKTYNPVAIISPGEFVGTETTRRSKVGRNIYVTEKDKITGELRDIQIREINSYNEKKYLSQLIVADHGKEIIKLDEDGSVHKAIRLFEGYIISFNPANKSSEVTDFRKGSMDIYLDPKSKKRRGFKANLPAHYNFSELIFTREKTRFKRKIKQLKKLTERRKLYNRGKEKLEKYKTDLALLKKTENPTRRKKRKRRFNRKYKGFTLERGKKNLSGHRKKLRRIRKNLFNVVWEFTLELNQRFTYSVYCLIFGILGVCLGLVNNRSGRGLGFVASILLVVIYVSGFQIGRRMASKNQIDPGLAPWLGVFVVFFVLLYYLYVRLSNRSVSETIRHYFYALKLRKKN